MDPRPAVDLVERDFTAHGPDQLWGADITYKSFFATLEYKLLDQERFKTQAEAKMAVFHRRRLLQPPPPALYRSVRSRRSTSSVATRPPHDRTALFTPALCGGGF